MMVDSPSCDGSKVSRDYVVSDQILLGLFNNCRNIYSRHNVSDKRKPLVIYKWEIKITQTLTDINRPYKVIEE